MGMGNIHDGVLHAKFMHEPAHESGNISYRLPRLKNFL